MSAVQVSNPIPKNTKTINDVISSQDMSAYESNKESYARRGSSKHNELNRDLNRSGYQSYQDSGIDSDYVSQTEKRNKKIHSVSRKNKGISRRKLMEYKGVKIKAPPNDFDPDTVNDGLDEIDILIDQLENGIPDDVYETEEFEVDGMMKANRRLREKIGQISNMVINAITKAGNLKKEIITHRFKTDDYEVAQKEKEMNHYQNKINK